MHRREALRGNGAPGTEACEKRGIAGTERIHARIECAGRRGRLRLPRDHRDARAAHLRSQRARERRTDHSAASDRYVKLRFRIHRDLSTL
jgi:hypothetical protein